MGVADGRALVEAISFPLRFPSFLEDVGEEEVVRKGRRRKGEVVVCCTDRNWNFSLSSWRCASSSFFCAFFLLALFPGPFVSNGMICCSPSVRSRGATCVFFVFLFFLLAREVSEPWAVVFFAFFRPLTRATRRGEVEEEEVMEGGEVGVDDSANDAVLEDKEDHTEALGWHSFSLAFFPEDWEVPFPVARTSVIGFFTVFFVSLLPDIAVVVLPTRLAFVPSPPRTSFASPFVSSSIEPSCERDTFEHGRLRSFS